MMSFEQIPIGELLPQRPPFVFVDSLLYYDPTVTRTAFRVPETGLFVEDGCFRTAGLIEHMAQSAAARIGYISRYVLHVPVRIGYIGNVRKLEVFRNPVSGCLLKTAVFLREEIFGITLTDVEVRCGDELIARASLKTALSEKEVEI